MRNLFVAEDLVEQSIIAIHYSNKSKRQSIVWRKLSTKKGVVHISYLGMTQMCCDGVALNFDFINYF